MIGYGLLLLLAAGLGRLGAASWRDVPWRTVAGGLALQWVLALLLLRVPAARRPMLALNGLADALQRAADEGTRFLFGYLAGPPLPFAEAHPGAAFILAFKMLPLVLLISALGSLLFHWGVLQAVVGLFAALLRRGLGIDGPLAVAAAVHVFVGMIEAPLLIRPYLARMQPGELFAMMTAGMAGVAGTVMVIYGAVLEPVVPNALGMILVASIISTPAALAVAALMRPWSACVGAPAVLLERERATGSLDALVRGTAEGIAPLVGILSVLIVTVALVSLANGAVGLVAPVTLQSLLAWPLRPVVWAIGIPWAESATAAHLLATRTILNEFVAYLDLAALPASALSPTSRRIMTFALCGFANLGSVGIMVGALSTMLPERRGEIGRLALLSLVSGTIATCLSGAVAGVIGG